jgi:hypothetical protein
MPFRNKQKQLAYHREWYARNKEQECARARANNALREDEIKDQQLRRKYGLTLVEFESMYRDQAGVCKICGNPETAGRCLAVDHCHETGAVRGLLCTNCNQGLGKFHDSIDTLIAACIYLKGDTCMGFAERVRQYNAQKDTKVNPPEAEKVLEKQSAPEVAAVKAPPAESAAAPVSSASNETSPVASGNSAPSADQSTSSEAGAQTEGKAKRGRPAGSKNSPKPPTADTSTEVTSAAVPDSTDLARIADALERLVYLKERELLAKVDF